MPGKSRYPVPDSKALSQLPLPSSHRTAQKGTFDWFARSLAIDTKTLSSNLLGQGSVHILEGMLGGPLERITSGRGPGETRSIEPGDGGGGDAELQMIGHRLRIAGPGAAEAGAVLPLSSGPARGGLGQAVEGAALTRSHESRWARPPNCVRSGLGLIRPLLPGQLSVTTTTGTSVNTRAGAAINRTPAQACCDRRPTGRGPW